MMRRKRIGKIMRMTITYLKSADYYTALGIACNMKLNVGTLNHANQNTTQSLSQKDCPKELVQDMQCCFDIFLMISNN
jgi:hypothetical protein